MREHQWQWCWIGSVWGTALQERATPGDVIHLSPASPQCWTSREWIPQLDALMDPADDDSSTQKQQRQKCIRLCGAMSRLTRVIIQDMTPLDLWSSGWMSSLSSLHLQNTSCVYLLQLGLQSAEQLRDSSNKMCKDRSSWIITKTESLK